MEALRAQQRHINEVCGHVDSLQAEKTALKQHREMIARKIKQKIDYQEELEAQLAQEASERADLEVQRDQVEKRTNQIEEELEKLIGDAANITSLSGNGTSSNVGPTNPSRTSSSPSYNPAVPTSPGYRSSSDPSPYYSPTLPQYPPATPAYSATSPAYSPASPKHGGYSQTVMQNASKVMSAANIDQVRPPQATMYHPGHVHGGLTANFSQPMATGQLPTSQVAGCPTDASTTDDDTIHVSARTKTLAKPREDIYNFDTSPKQLSYDSLMRAEKIENYEVVVYMDWKWTEISCGICGKNAMFSKEKDQLRFIGGAIGLVNHIRFHFTTEEGSDFEKLDKHEKLVKLVGSFSRREVGDEDAALMKAGKDPKVEIRKIIGAPSPQKKTPTKRKAEQKQQRVPKESTTPKAIRQINGSPFKRSKTTPNAFGNTSTDVNRRSEMAGNHTNDGESRAGETVQPK